MTFKSTYDGDTHRLTPEGAVDVQLALGADIQMVLDECAPLPSPDDVIRGALERTADWAHGLAGTSSPPTTARPQPVRHRPGRGRRGDAGRERPAHGRHRLRRLRHRRAVGGGVTRRDAAGARRRRRRTCPSIGPGT